MSNFIVEENHTLTCMSALKVMMWWAGVMGKWRTPKMGTPGPNFPGSMGICMGPHFPGNIGTTGPHFPGNIGTTGPHFPGVAMGTPS